MLIRRVRYKLTGFFSVLFAELGERDESFACFFCRATRIWIRQMARVFAAFQLLVWLVAVRFNSRRGCCRVTAVSITSQLVARLKVIWDVEGLRIDTRKPRIGSDATSLSRTRSLFEMKSWELAFNPANETPEIKFTSKLRSHDDIFPQHGTHAGIWDQVTIALDTCCSDCFSSHWIDALTRGSRSYRILTEIKRFRPLMGELLLEYQRENVRKVEDKCVKRRH